MWDVSYHHVRRCRLDFSFFCRSQGYKQLLQNDPSVHCSFVGLLCCCCFGNIFKWRIAWYEHLICDLLFSTVFKLLFIFSNRLCVARQFSSFVRKYNKNYATQEESERRFANFKVCRVYTVVLSHNRKISSEKKKQAKYWCYFFAGISRKSPKKECDLQGTTNIWHY